MLQKAVNPRVFVCNVHSHCVYAAYHTWSACTPLSDNVVFHCGDRGGKGKEQAKLKIAMMHRGLIRNSACGTGCLFNSARMWIMRGKIPEHRPHTGGSAQWVLLLFISAIYIPRSKIWAFFSLHNWCMHVFWSMLNHFFCFPGPCTCCVIYWSRHNCLSCNVQCRCEWFCTFLVLLYTPEQSLFNVEYGMIELDFVSMILNSVVTLWYLTCNILYVANHQSRPVCEIW